MGGYHRTANTKEMLQDMDESGFLDKMRKHDEEDGCPFVLHFSASTLDEMTTVLGNNLRRFESEVKAGESDWKKGMWDDEKMGQHEQDFYEAMLRLYPEGSHCRTRLEQWMGARKMQLLAARYINDLLTDEIWRDVRANNFPFDMPEWDAIERFTSLSRDELGAVRAEGDRQPPPPQTAEEKAAGVPF